MIEKDYLGAWDLVHPDGKTPKDFTLEIESVKSTVVKTRDTPKGKRRCTIRFKGARKAFIANTTNCETIESLYGWDTDGWIGKRVTLYQGDVRNPKGKPPTIKGVCVRPRRPDGPAESVPEREVDQEMRNQQNEAFGREPEREPGEEG